MLKSYSALAHGSRYLHYWRYGPSYANYLPYSWSHNRSAVKQIATVCRDVARIEETLMEAERVPAPVALLYAKNDPIWGRGQTENRLVFFALLHDQIPVDIVTEAQVEKDGLLEHYNYLYVTDISVRRRTLAGIAEWVRDGGRVWLSGGAGTRNQFDEPCRTLTDALGVTVLAREDASASIPGPGQKSATEVRSPFRIKAAGASATLRFEDGSPALLVGEAGKGTYCVCAFRPGGVYEAPVRSHFNRAHGKGRIQGGWRARRRSWITGFALRNDCLRPVTLDRPCVEAILYRHHRRDLLMLINYTGSYTNTPLCARVRGSGDVIGVESLRQGPLEFRRDGGVVSFQLPLHRADTVCITHQPENNHP
ncbi:MAG: hypothetical protein ACLFWL_04475 [Candidatus Brocadiia bacterium]